MLLRDALVGYWLDKRVRFSARTARDYELTFRRLADYLGDARTIESITGADLRAFLAAMRDQYNLRPKSVINVWIALSSLWTWAEKELRIPHAARGVARPAPRPSFGGDHV